MTHFPPKGSPSQMGVPIPAEGGFGLWENDRVVESCPSPPRSSTLGQRTPQNPAGRFWFDWTQWWAQSPERFWTAGGAVRKALRLAIRSCACALRGPGASRRSPGPRAAEPAGCRRCQRAKVHGVRPEPCDRAQSAVDFCKS